MLLVLGVPLLLAGAVGHTGLPGPGRRVVMIGVLADVTYQAVLGVAVVGTDVSQRSAAQASR